MQLIAMLRGDPWLPQFTGRVIKHNMDDSGPGISENYHEAIREANRQLVIEALEAGRDDVKGIAEYAKVDYTTAKSHLDRLIKMGRVEFVEVKSRRGRKRLYGIAK